MGAMVLASECNRVGVERRCGTCRQAAAGKDLGSCVGWVYGGHRDEREREKRLLLLV